MVENITNLASGLLSKIDFIWYVYRLEGNTTVSALLPRQRGGSAPTRVGAPCVCLRGTHVFWTTFIADVILMASF